MQHIVYLILKRPIAAGIAFLALAVGGTLSIVRIPLDNLPQMEVPQITVAAIYEGLPARDVRELVTIPLEEALSSLNGLKHIRSYSRNGSSLIQLTLEWGSSMDKAALQAREIIDIAYLSLPSHAEKPLVLPVDPGETPVMLLGVFPVEGASPSVVFEMARRELQAAIQQVEGVGSLQVIGGRQEIIEVSVDQSRLSKTEKSFFAVVDAIGGMNAEYPSGSLDDGDTRYTIKVDGRRQSWEDIADIGIGDKEAGKPLRVQDVAQVRREFDERKAFLISDGMEGIALQVRRNRGYSPVSLSRNLKAQIAELNRTFRKDLRIKVIYDRSEEIVILIRRLLYSGLLGAAAAFAVLLFFLRRLGHALVILTSIPLCLLGTLLSLGMMGISLNIMSLGGLALGVGMLVDNSVVVLENLVKRINCCDKMEIAAATSEITQSTVGSTLTSIVVFIPLLFLPGLMGALFSDLAWAVILSLTFSLFVAGTWIPLLFSRLRLQAVFPYEPPKWLRRFLRNRLRRFGLLPAFALLGIAVIALTRMDFRWLQPIRQFRIDVTVRHPPGTSVEHLFSTGIEMITLLGQQPGIQSASAIGGGSLQDPYFLADPTRSQERTDYRISLDKNSSWTPQGIRRLIQDRLMEDTTVEAGYPPDFLEQVLNLNDDYSRLMVPAEDAKAAIRSARFFKSMALAGQPITQMPENLKPFLQITPDRQIVAHHGLDITFLARAIGSAVAGKAVGDFEEQGRRIPIRVRLRKQDRQDRQALEALNILSTPSGVISLSSLSVIDEQNDYPILFREGRKDVSYLIVPKEDAIEWISRGQGRIVNTESTLLTEQRNTFIIIILLAVGLLYVLLGIQFNSFSLPLILLLTQPFALAGTILLLWLSGKGLNLSALLGMQIVVGLSINNAILLYENYHRRRLAGVAPGVAVYAGTLDRVRPILITACTTIAALLPPALDFSGRNPQDSLAMAVVGGLLIAIPIALFILPPLFCGYLGYLSRKADKAGLS